MTMQFPISNISWSFSQNRCIWNSSKWVLDLNRVNYDTIFISGRFQAEEFGIEKYTYEWGERAEWEISKMDVLKKVGEVR